MLDLTDKILGQYHITAKIGEGGMAVVFKAKQLSLERDVAIKVLPPSFAQDPEFVKRFQREARAIARLNHPNILPVYDFGVDQNYSYIVMRYVESGQTLSRVMRQPLRQERAIELISQVGSALAYAHKRGVIHRDLKPGNVLIDDGWPLLSDFGLAKVGEVSTSLTKSGKFLGTPRYMSPEQLEGQKVDCRTDIYALAVVLYEMLTGTNPHDADTPWTIIKKRTTEPPPAPRTLNPDISKSVEQVLLRALAIEPKDRYDSTDKFVAALQQAFVEDESTVAYTSPPLIRSTPFPGGKSSINRFLKRWLVWVFIVIVGFIGIGMFVWYRGSFSSPAPQLSSIQTTSIPMIAQNPTPTPTATPIPTPTLTPTSTPTPPTSPTLSPSPTPSATNTPMPPTDTPTTAPTNTPTETFTPTSAPPTPTPVLVDVMAPKSIEYNGEAFFWEWENQSIPEEIDWYFDIKIFGNTSVEEPYHVIVAEPQDTQKTDGIWNFTSGTLDLRCGSYWAVQIAKRNPDGEYAGSLSSESDRLPIEAATCGGSSGDDGGNVGGSGSGPGGVIQ